MAKQHSPVPDASTAVTLPQRARETTRHDTQRIHRRPHLPGLEAGRLLPQDRHLQEHAEPMDARPHVHSRLGAALSDDGAGDQAAGGAGRAAESVGTGTRTPGALSRWCRGTKSRPRESAFAFRPTSRHSEGGLGVVQLIGSAVVI